MPNVPCSVGRRDPSKRQDRGVQIPPRRWRVVAQRPVYISTQQLGESRGKFREAEWIARRHCCLGQRPVAS